jgi:hypothetical protein
MQKSLIMKKRIALEDKKDLEFDLTDPLVYFNDRKVYPAVQDLMIINIDDDEDGLDFDISELSLPNLRSVNYVKLVSDRNLSITTNLFEKIGSESFYNVKDLVIADLEDDVEFHGWVSNCINLESVELEIPRYNRLPFDLSNSLKLKILSIRTSKITQIPDSVFNCKQLESLQFLSCRKIREISDDIKKLENLKSFWLRKADFRYVSPELFKLPNLQEICLEFSMYRNPPDEIYNAIIELKQRKPDLRVSFDRDSWFREIWDQI